MPPWQGRQFSGTGAIIDEVAQHPLNILNTLYVAPQAFGELGDAFRRNSHWRQLAGGAEDEGEALLLYWMSAECLCKQSHDEEIGSKLLAACGFPTGVIAGYVSSAVASQVALLRTHRSWRRALAGLFEALRIARNKIVHAGFRHVDLPAILSEDQRALGMFVLPLAATSLANMALQALAFRHKTLAAMWQNYEAMLLPAGLVQHAQWFIDRLESSEARMTRTWGSRP